MNDSIECMEHSVEYMNDDVVVMTTTTNTASLKPCKTPINCCLQTLPSLTTSSDTIHCHHCSHSIDNTIQTNTCNTDNTANGLTNDNHHCHHNRLIPLSSVIYFIIISIITAFISRAPIVVDCRPVSPKTRSLDKSAYTLDYMFKYGYLPKDDIKSGNLMNADAIHDAIQHMQRFAGLPATGVVDNQTLTLMLSRMCNIPDIFPNHILTNRRQKRYVFSGAKWDRTALTWSLQDYPPDMDYHHIVDQFVRAFRLWSDVSLLTFTQTRSQTADIVIKFARGDHGDQYPFDGPGKILGHAFFPGNDIGGDAHFDSDEQWNQPHDNQIDPAQRQGVSLFSAAAHEFGHSLGLMHSSVWGSLMFPYYQTVPDDYKLPRDDILGIQHIYGSRAGWSPYTTLPTPKPRPGVTQRPTMFSSQFPNPCNTSIDAIASLRNEIFIFKSKYFWWLKADRTLDRTEPIEIIHYWPELPKALTKVDAVYERVKDHMIAFFIGRQIYVFNAQNRLERGYPRSLESIGLPSSLDHIDAAMIWGHNAKPYLFSGHQYWRYDEDDDRIELDYPRDTSVWKGIPFPIDAGFQWYTDGQTYFFKGLHYWKFDNRLMQASDGYPQSIGPFWFKSLLCRDNHKVPETWGDSGATSSVYSINLMANKCWTQTILLLILFVLRLNSLVFYNKFYILHIF